MSVVRCCNLCAYFNYEEIGDSDFSPVYSEERGCDKGLDLGQDEHLIEDFDRTIERPCCSLDFWSVIDLDPAIKREFDRETAENNGTSFESTYELFKRKYNIQL